MVSSATENTAEYYYVETFKQAVRDGLDEQVALMLSVMLLTE